MSSWETVSVRFMGGDVENYQRFTSNMDSRVENVLVGSKGCTFDGDTFWLSHDVGDAYLVSVSDTSDMGTITQLFGDNEWSVEKHNRSLWEVEYHSYEPQYKQDILETLPEWVTVGGNWSYMDE